MAIDKAIDSSQLDSDLTSVADAIRAKSGGSAALAFPSGFVSEIQAIPTGGGGYTIDDFVIWGGITGNVVITKTSVRDYALASCTQITGISAPNLTGIATLCFSYMTRLQTISLPALRTANKKCMVNDTNLVSVSLPVLTTITYDQFIENSKLQYLVLPSFTGTIYNSSLRTNVSLLAVDLNAATSIGVTAFSGCSALSTLIIRGNSLTDLKNISAFTNTPFASGKAGGTLYVPQALISAYQSATNWSTILGYASNQILPIEGSIYETQYADGTPIPTT